MSNTQYFILCAILTVTQCSHSAENKTLIKAALTSTQIESLVQFHLPTSNLDTSAAPTSLKNYTQRGRTFVARIDLGLPNYYQLKRDKDIGAAVERLKTGHAWSVAWLYYDQERKARTRNCSIL